MELTRGVRAYPEDILSTGWADHHALVTLILWAVVLADYMPPRNFT